jgi:HEAT repeat protein
MEELLPPRPTAERSVSLLPLLESALIQEARPALQQSEEAVKVISMALTTPPELGWHPLTSELRSVSAELRSRALESAARIASSLTSEFVVQSSHPDIAVRSAAVRVLTTLSNDEAHAAIQSVFTRGDEETCRAVLAALVDFPNPALLVPVSELLVSTRPWPIRQLAARTLRDLSPSKLSLATHVRASKFPVTATTAVTSALLSAVKDDPNAFVREQALAAWVAWTGREASDTLTNIAQSDPEVRVRKTAEELLQGLQ